MMAGSVAGHRVVYRRSLWALWVALTSLFCAVAEATETAAHRNLVILHTDNLEGRLLSWLDTDDVAIGGMARTVHLLRATDEGALILDGGDAIGPALLSRYDRGRTMFRLMNRSGYDGLVLGNHDLAAGLDSLRERAREAQFPLLAANLIDEETDAAVFPTYAIVERQGLRIGLTGVLSPEFVELVHPLELTGLRIASPEDALRTVLDSLKGRVDFTIALVHMRYEEVLGLAQQSPEIDLFIAGGYRGSTTIDQFIHTVQLANGNRVVSTPGSSFIGRVEVTMEQAETGWRPLAMRAGLQQVNAATTVDDTARQWIETHRARFLASRSEVLGMLDEEHEDAVQFVAQLMQAGAGAELAMINRGTLRPLALSGDVRLSGLDSLMRFEDDIVIVRMQGSELEEIIEESRQRGRESQQLVFAGYDQDEDSINGRPFDKSETFQVATTRFLAHGGDGYMKGKDVAEPRRGRLTLRGVTLEAIRHGGALPWATRPRGRNAWKTHWEGDMAMSLHNAKGFGDADDGQGSLAWNGKLEGRGSHETPNRVFGLDFRTHYSQVLESGALAEKSDRVDGKMLFTWHRMDPAPFFAVDLETEWTARERRDRVFTMRGSSGLETEFGELGVRLGLGIEHDFAKRESRLGVEMVPEYSFKLFEKVKVDLEAEVFYAAAENRLSIDNQNKLKVELPGNLKLTADADLKFDWDELERGLESEVQVGLGIGYEWGGKLAR